MLIRRGVHVYATVGGEYFLDDVIVLLLLEDTVLATLRSSVGVVPAFHHHIGAGVIACEDAQPDDDAVEQRLRLVYSACVQMDAVAGLEQHVVTLVESLLVHVAGIELQCRLADTVQFQPH